MAEGAEGNGMNKEQIRKAILEGSMTLKEVEKAVQEGLIDVNEVCAIEEEAQQLNMGDIYPDAAEYFKIDPRIKELQETFQEETLQLQGPLKELTKAAYNFTKARPFISMLNEAYTKEAAFMRGNVSVVMAPIELYIYEKGLEEASVEDKEAHREDFLAFFAEYLKAWEAIKNKRNITKAIEQAFKALREQGLINQEDKAADAMDKAHLYGLLLHRPGLDQLALLDRKRLDIKQNDTTGLNSLSMGQLTVIEDFGQDIALTDPSGEEVIPEERKKYFDALFQKLAKRLSSVDAMKWLDISVIQLTMQNRHKGGKRNTKIEQPLEMLMEAQGIPITKASMDKYRATLKEIQEAFFSFRFIIEENVGNGKKVPYHQRILQRYSEIKDNVNYVRFTEDVTEYLCQGYRADLPLSLLKIDGRNPSAYAMGRYIALRYSNLSNQEDGTADIVSVKALLENAPGIPAEHEVEAAGERQQKQRIIKAFETAMKKLDFLESWEYCNAKKAPLTKAQRDNFNYRTFKNCYIRYTFRDAKDYKPFLEAKVAANAEANNEAKPKAKGRKKTAAPLADQKQEAAE